MKHESVAAAAVGVIAILFGSVVLVVLAQRDEARAQAAYAKSRQSEAEKQVEFWRMQSGTWEKLSGTNERLSLANAYRAEACERLMKIEEKRP